jgi:protein involved in polysaccharide export with SLBB domain
MGTISLAGVLRSELSEHMGRELTRYIQNPRVQTTSMIRLQVRGAVGNLGFHFFPSDMLLSDALMTAGGFSQAADLDDIVLERAGERLMDADDVTVALADGRSLDQLGLQAGDIVVVAEDRPSRVWPVVLRWTAIIVSTTLLGIRIF